LKTLEEPPAYVIFILLTTEISKVPITILSRCQKFNLKRLNSNDLLALLEHVCQSELVDYDKAALENIAHKADGSARDALVLLEQTLFLARQKNTKLSIEIACESLDLNVCKHAITFLSLILERNTQEAIKLIDELYKNNFDFINIIQSMIELIAFLSKLKLIPSYEWGHYSLYSKDIQKILDSSDLAFLTSLWQILNKGIGEITSSLNQLTSFEMLVVKAIYCSMIPSMEEVLANNNDTSFQVNALPAHNKQEDVLPADKHTNNTYKTHDDTIKLDFPKIQESYLSTDQASQITDLADNSVKFEKHVDSDVCDTQIDDMLVYNFIKHLHENHMLEIYNFIMNKCEIINFKSFILKVNVEKVSNQTKEQVNVALNSWMPGSWQVIYTTTRQIDCLQNKLKAKALQDQNFKQVASFFPQTQLSDVLFNFMMK
jgi:DNA polymerase-3 subunit gamma/tau